MSEHGVVAIHGDRLDAFADALLRVAEDLLGLRLKVCRILDGVAAVPAGVHDLGAVATRVRLLGLDTRRRLGIIRNLPWDDYPMPTSVLLDRPVAGPFAAVEIAMELEALGWKHGLRADEAGEYLDRLLAAVEDDPYEAAALLDWLGAERFRHLYELADRENGIVAPDDREDAFAARSEAITDVLLAASRTVDHPGGLSRRFVDGLFPGSVQDGAPVDPSELDAVQDLLGVAGAGQYLVAATQEAVRGGVGGLVTGAGRVVAVFGVFSALADVVSNWGDVGPVAEAVVSGTLGVIGAFGGPIGWTAASLGFVLWLVTNAPASGPAPPRTYPADQPNPGGAHYTHTVNGAGVPVAPNGR